MKPRRLALVVLMLGAILGCLGAGFAQEKLRWYSFGNTPNEEAVLKYLVPALTSAGNSSVLYYSGVYNAKGSDPVPFPLLELQPPSKGETGLAAVREIFQNDKDVTVSEKPSGTITIKVGDVSPEILETKISLLTLDRTEQYSPGDAITAIEKTKEVEASMRRFRFRPTLNLGGQVVQSAEGLPHLPPSMKNVTVDQALGSIAETFRGIVVYGVCAQPNGTRLLYIDLAYAQFWN
jgi:hypothetical protein